MNKIKKMKELELPEVSVGQDGNGDKNGKDALMRQGNENDEVITAVKTVESRVQMPSEDTAEISPVPLVAFPKTESSQPLVVFGSTPTPLVEFVEEPVENFSARENTDSHPLVMIDCEKRMELQTYGGILAVPNSISIMGGGLQIISCDGCTFVKGDESREFLMNFTVKILFMTKNQNGILEDLFFEVCTEEGEKVGFDVSYENRKNLLDIIRKKIAYAYLSPTIKNGKDIFDVYIGALTKKVPVKTKIGKAGWYDSLKRYVTDDCSLGKDFIINTGKSFERDWNISDFQLGCYVHQMLNISINTAHGVICVTYALTGVLAKPFEDAGYPIRFTLFVNGKTGSLKTALAKVVFCYFNPTKPKQLHTFRDTANSIDIYAGAQRDDICLLDDFRPPTSKAHKAHMDEVLERMITHIGDGVSKNRTNANLERVDGKIHRGGSVITGEYKGGGESSRLRCFFLDVQNDEIQGEKLRFFQNNPRCWTSVLARFVKYVEKNYDGIVAYIRENMERKRKDLDEQAIAKRCCEQGATFYVIYDLLCDFLLSLKTPVQKEIKDTHIQCILETLQKSESAAREMSTTNCYAKALHYIYLKHQIVLENSLRGYGENVAKCDGFVENGYLYVDDTKVKALIHACLTTSAQGYLDGAQGTTELADLGILSTFSNGKNKRSFCVRRTYNGIVYRFWKINIKRLVEVANE